MNRAEYMRCKGELATAREQHNALSGKLTETKSALRNWINSASDGPPLTPVSAQKAKDLIDQWMTLQAEELQLRQTMASFNELLKPFPTPPTE